jgi:hypothetical protein
MGIMAIDIHLGRRPTNDHPRLRRTLMDSKKKKKKKKDHPRMTTHYHWHACQAGKLCGLGYSPVRRKCGYCRAGSGASCANVFKLATRILRGSEVHVHLSLLYLIHGAHVPIYICIGLFSAC